jgi:tRNA threonylcarbamoyladenosine biosynthesis protein TsaE
MTSDVLALDLPTLRATAELARAIAPVLARGDLVVLDGPLGSGKTTFTRALCRALGLPRRIRVPSPTFTLVHEYDLEPPICHADVYRLGSAKDVVLLGLDAQRDDGKVLVVEWGEPYVELLGGDALVVSFAVDPRRATLRSTGRRSAEMLVELAKVLKP